MKTLDIEHPESLLTYLRRSGHIAEGESPRIDVLAGGVSKACWFYGEGPPDGAACAGVEADA